MNISSTYKRFRHRRFSDEYIEWVWNLSASYPVSEQLIVGAGVNYIFNDRGVRVNPESNGKGKTFSIDIGVSKKFNQITTDRLMIKPTAGFSLSDFCPKITYFDGDEGEALPMMIRGGAGVEFASLRNLNGFSYLGLTYSFGLARVVNRVDIKNDGSINVYGPFEALIKSWRSYKYFTGKREKTVTLKYQIWIQNGVKISTLESFFFRLGYQNVEDVFGQFTYFSWGFGIDLGYIAFDYANADFENEELLSNDPQWQVTGRIP